MLWAHNLHVERNTTFWSTQGHDLAEVLGSDYVAIGTNFDQGGFTALDQSQSRPQGYPLTSIRQFTLGASSPGTLNEALASADAPIYVLDIRHAADDPVTGSWWAASRGQRFAGAVNSPGDVGYANVVPVVAWDLLVEIDRVMATDQLPGAWPDGPGNGNGQIIWRF
jgi:erythromycin esterase-like protein